MATKFVMGEVRLIEGKFGTVFMTRPSMLTGKFNQMCIAATSVEAIAEWLLARKAGQATKLVQDAFPHLSPAEREFIMTGITDAEWKDHVGVLTEEEDKNGEA